MLRGRSLRIAGVPVLALTLFSACYRYVPASPTDLTVGAAYRGHFTPEGSRQVAPIIGEDVERFDGRIITVLDTAYLVAMSATLKRADVRQSVWTGEQLLIPRSAVSRFELRELDRPRTMRAAALYTGGMLAIGVLVFSIKSLVSGSGSVAPPPPPP
jgi:hypothetical protein